MNSMVIADGLGNFSFFRALRITGSVIGVDVLSIGVILFRRSVILTHKKHKKYMPLQNFLQRHILFITEHYSSTNDTAFSAAMRRMLSTA